ncbi:TRAP transporter large permease [Alkalicoccobacillus murimartini]|uniref:Tripartite ATP-independent transporter DctM subunit n=1 Tax=Alkalicoccobacillus murimartini TaxID=171685 RepID=A0ABT9YH45_9BACI|nr:TRAP transporter large permease [Alkalicoccobacillus murimartini]MDQ0207187.1 tripartite ATP-independent transporter DctM subunit [Alkalicoccobacillus murimartini]
MILAITLILMLILMMMNIPVAYAMIAACAFYFIFNDSFANEILIQRMMSGIESFPLLAIVFFVTAGILMNYTGITERMLRFAQVLTGHMTGGLAKVNVLLSVLMGGLSGSNIADAAMQSKVLVPEMTKRNYPPAFSTALTAATSLITPIIPPGIALIMYGYIGNVSIGQLFMAGIVPGLMLSVIFLILVHFLAKKRGFEVEKKPAAKPKEILFASKDAILAILLPIIIIGGIRFGVFSPTEAGAVAVIYALLLGFLIYRKMTGRDLFEALKESVNLTATIMIIIAAGTAFGWILTLEQVPQFLTEYVTGYISSPAIFLFVVMIFLIAVGTLIEGNVLLIILTPILLPMVNSFGIDPVHFGLFFILCLSVGTITPPVGTIMFTTAAITKVKIEDFIKEVWPFWLALIVAILLIAYIPAISLWLPSIL